MEEGSSSLGWVRNTRSGPAAVSCFLCLNSGDKDTFPETDLWSCWKCISVTSLFLIFNMKKAIKREFLEVYVILSFLKKHEFNLHVTIFKGCLGWSSIWCEYRQQYFVSGQISRPWYYLLVLICPVLWVCFFPRLFSVLRDTSFRTWHCQ